MLIFTAVFTGMVLMFLSILVVVGRIQSRETAAAEVNQQSHFLLATIQDYVGRSSVIDITAGSATSTLRLRMPSSTQDPSYLYLQNGVVYIRETDSGTAQALSSSRVTVDALSFTRKTNAGGPDVVAVSLAVSYNTSNIQQMFSRTLLTGISRVSAAVFDSNIVPNAANTYKLGASQGDWQSINNTIYFSGSNVGVGVSTPGQTLEVNGGLRLNTTNGKPTCDSSQRGTFWTTQSGGGSKDAVEVCVRNASGTYLWATIY